MKDDTNLIVTMPLAEAQDWEERLYEMDPHLWGP